MPPRYAYWTILIDNKPTAFRARDKDELVPTLHQLRRTNPNAEMKWFARGKLWDTPEQARWAASNVEPQKRARDWRPGGEHKDPRDRFKKKRDRAQPPSPARPEPVEGRAPRASVTPASKSASKRDRRPWQGSRPQGEQRPWREKPSGPPRDRPWRGKPRAQEGRGDRPWSGKPKSGPPRGERPWSNRPTGGGARRDQPWREKPPAGPGAPKPREGTPGSPKPREGGPGSPRRREGDEPPKRRQETPETPPASEQIVTKPKPPERG